MPNEPIEVPCEMKDFVWEPARIREHGEMPSCLVCAKHPKSPSRTVDSVTCKYIRIFDGM